MRKLLLFTLFIFTILCHGFAKDSNANSKKVPIKVTTNDETVNKPTISRAPLYINLEAYYEAESGTITIFYEGQTEGEAYLYLNGNVVDYSGEINTTFDVTLPGLYEIEIITGSWTAYGSIEI